MPFWERRSSGSVIFVTFAKKLCHKPTIFSITRVILLSVYANDVVLQERRNMKRIYICIMLLGLCRLANAQMLVGTDTLYGNEWIDYTQTYYKIKVARDGIYRIGTQSLLNAGMPIATSPGSQFRLYHLGEEIPVYCSSPGIFGPTDFIEFYGEKNKGEIDYFLFEHADQEQINPLYSMFNDTAVYYLSLETQGQGKRFSKLANDLNNLPSKEGYCFTSTEQLLSSTIFKKKIGDEITYSWFDGAGYTGPVSAAETPISFTLEGFVSNGPDASMHVRYAGNLGDHHKQIYFNDSLYADDQFQEFGLIDRNFSIPASQLKVSSELIIKTPIGDRHGLAFANIEYARNFQLNNAGQFRFKLEAGAQDKYVEIEGFNSAAGTPVLYDLSNNIRLETTLESGFVKFKLPQNLSNGDLLLLSPGDIQIVNTLERVPFSNFQNTPADYVIISNKALFSDPIAAGANHVAEYATYRESQAGGAHSVAVFDIEDLYEQFSYGIRFHPIAIRNFLHWAKKQWPQLEHAFIIGKALDFYNFRSASQQSTFIDSLFFVPNFSAPGADLPFVMSGNHLSDPIMAIGRLAVTRASEISDYLDKVKQHEQQLGNADQSIASKAWMKRVIHNSGGLSGENVLIKNFTTSMGNTIAENRFGADVHSFYKTSDDPIQLSAYEQLLDLINDGTAIWTIFGHSSAFAVDFDIGLPSAYNNFGRYPLMMVLGCFSGICSAPQQGIGEQFVLAKDRGAIAYIASVNYSFIDALHTYGRQYYSRLGGSDYGKSVGQILANTIADLKDAQNEGLIALLHQNLLQGDPAIKLLTHDGPDYLIDRQSVQIDPSPASINYDHVQFSFDVVNIGENTGNSLTVKLDQRLPDNQTVLPRELDTIQAPGFRRKLEYAVPVAGSKIGFNRYFLELDPNNDIAEQPFGAENNNSLLDANGSPGKDIYFFADDISPVYPPPFAIVGKADLTLHASTLNPVAPVYPYVFEIDTIETFDSNLKESFQMNSPGGLITWKPTLPLQDSTVYYWRVARDSLVNGQPLWHTQSFIFINGSPPGWNQSDYGQYKTGDFTNLQASDSLREISFEDNAAFVSVQIAYRGVNRYPGFKNSFYQGFYGDFGFNQQNIVRGICMMLLDQNSGKAIINPANGPYNYDPQMDREFFWFDTRNESERVKMMDFLENYVPEGSYIGLLAFNRVTDATGYGPHLWANDSITQGKNLFQILENQGARHVRELANFSTAPAAYGFVFRKAHPEYENRDTFTYDTDATLELRASFTAKWALGLMDTKTIGPVKNWNSILWERDDFDDSSDDAILSVLGVREGLEDTILISLRNGLDSSLNNISAVDFPQLKLRYEVSDTQSRTVTPLRYLRVLYDPIPEGALAPNKYFSFYKDTLEQGDIFKSGIAFANISEVPFDSVLFRISVDNQLNNGFAYEQRLKALMPGDTLHADFLAVTRFINGLQKMTLEANPHNDQPESYHFNNVLVRDFYIKKDERNPLLDVTFDGQHILDGDLISPQPVVMISLKDDNPYIPMRDSSTFSISLILPNGQIQDIPHSDPTVMFFPADPTALPQKNLARIEWRPTFLQDGEYKLLVNGKDASGNLSAALDWSVSFRIINKSSLSSLLNYPNPFSSSTCFLYTLTGVESPAHFKIQIMTINGRVVREITEQEFGPLKPGTHMSEFCWNGRDEYGDQLANGIYLYRVIAKKTDGSDFELFENNSVDSFFKHGFGKMVLMR